MSPAKSPAPAKQAAARKAASQATITLKHIVAELAENHDVPKKHVQTLFTDLATLTTQHLKKGGKIRLTGLGSPLGERIT